MYSLPPVVMHISLASYVIQIVHLPFKTLDPPLGPKIEPYGIPTFMQLLDDNDS